MIEKYLLIDPNGNSLIDNKNQFDLTYLMLALTEKDKKDNYLILGRQESNPNQPKLSLTPKNIVPDLLYRVSRNQAVILPVLFEKFNQAGMFIEGLYPSGTLLEEDSRAKILDLGERVRLRDRMRISLGYLKGLSFVPVIGPILYREQEFK